MKNLHNFEDWKDIQEHQMIGEILLESGKINLIHLGMALDIQRFQKLQLGEIFKAMELITADELNTALELQKKIDENIKNKG